ncbi:hypothetical protein D9M71_673270 [compost metagenome]
MRAVLDDKGVDRIFSADLLAALVDDDEAPWATLNRGKPMRQRQLTANLQAFGIKSKDIRKGLEVKKGYLQEQFTDAFQRYLFAGTPSASATPLQPINGKASSVAECSTAPPNKNPSATRKAPNGAVCSDVADQTPLWREKAGDDDTAEYF